MAILHHDDDLACVTQKNNLKTNFLVVVVRLVVVIDAEIVVIDADDYDIVVVHELVADELLVADVDLVVVVADCLVVVVADGGLVVTDAVPAWAKNGWAL